MRPFRRWLVIATATASATACGFHSLGGGPGDAGASGNAGDGSSTIVDAGIDATHANDATHAKDAVAARDTGVVSARDTGAVGAQDTGLAGQPDTGVVSQPDAGVVGQPDTGVVSDGAAAEFCATVTGTAGCSGCACASCTSTMNECAADTDCVALLSCYQASGCSDVLTCFQAGGPCAATYGAHSGGATKGEALSTCLQGSCLAACTVGAEPDAAAPPFDGGTSPACGATVGDAGACTSCACQSCPAQSNACFANADCAALDRCFQAYACLDPVSCFSGPCASTYEAHSGGQSAALNLYSCERTAGCSHACALAQPAADAGGSCGDIGEPCCPGAEPECNTGLACRSDSAGSVCGCGQEGEPCCPNDVCLGPSGSDERAQCFNGTCGYCYTTGATICTLPPCIGSGLCCDGCSLDTINGCSFAVTCN
jgi:hypothetical protein